MLPGPVFNAELITTSRRARYYVLRSAYGLLLLFFIWESNSSMLEPLATDPGRELTIQEMSRLGWVLFATFLSTQAICVLVLTPALVAGVIADERQRKTLDYLLSSRLTSAEIVLGKLSARLLHVGTFLLIGLPVVVMLTFFGGVDPNAVVLAFVGSGTAVYFLASLSILVSTRARRPREAVSLAFVLGLFWLFGPDLAMFIMPRLGPVWLQFYEYVRPVILWVAPSSPFHLVTTATGLTSSRTVLEAVFWMIGLQLVYGTVLLAFAVARIRALFRKGTDGPTRMTWAFLQRARRLLPRPACGDDAMLWKERYVSRTSPLTKIVAGFALLGVALLLGYLMVDFAVPAFREVVANGYGLSGNTSARQEFNTCLRMTLTMLAACLLLGVASAASSGLTSEREEDTWMSLIATPLTPWEVVRAKMVGAVWGLRWLGLLWLALALTGLALGAVHPLGFTAVVVETAVYVGFSSALGTFYSVVNRSSARALTATAGSLILINGVYLIALIPFRLQNYFPLLGVTLWVEAMSLMSYGDARGLFSGGTEFTYANSFDVALTCAASVAVYGLAALVLTGLSVTLFDAVLDRPRTEGTVRRRPDDRVALLGLDSELA
jgi:ABC-type transport system involved in multi-copper enzyme maturation permease subunit